MRRTAVAGTGAAAGSPAGVAIGAPGSPNIGNWITAERVRVARRAGAATRGDGSSMRA